MQVSGFVIENYDINHRLLSVRVIDWKIEPLKLLELIALYQRHSLSRDLHRHLGLNLVTVPGSSNKGVRDGFFKKNAMPL